MMNYEMFKGIVEAELSNFLAEEYKLMKVVIKPVNKVNVRKDAVFLFDEKAEKEFNVSPAIYLDDMFRNYEQCESLPTVMTAISEKIKEGIVEAPNIIDQFDLENSKDKIIWQLINTDQNKELLAECPHRDINDLSVIYRIVVSEKDDMVASCIVNNNVAEVLGLSEQELFEIAADNTQRLYPVEIIGMNQMMRNLFKEDGMPDEIADAMIEEMSESEAMYVISNSRHVDGAVSMLYVDKLDELAEKIGDDLYILPSSLHEVLAVPASIGDPKTLADMVYQINMAQVSLEDRLSNQVYHYDRTAKSLTPATTAPVESIGDKVAEQSVTYETKQVRK
ncbi:MAG: hypothetical protein J6M65_11100 [Eubacterium sp.]|nr:hypothetical protein [Eubacterium sp.]